SARPRAVIATGWAQLLQQRGAGVDVASQRRHAGMVCAVLPGNERTFMGPAIALRLRQHLTLTPQVQQALKLLQMSALEFAQEMEQALTANPFLEENPEAPQPALRDAATLEDVVVPQEQPSAPPVER